MTIKLKYDFNHVGVWPLCTTCNFKTTYVTCLRLKLRAIVVA